LELDFEQELKNGMPSIHHGPMRQDSVRVGLGIVLSIEAAQDWKKEGACVCTWND
jgi:hypothetical protein